MSFIPLKESSINILMYGPWTIERLVTAIIIRFHYENPHNINSLKGEHNHACCGNNVKSEF